MTSSLELNVEAFNSALEQKGWTIVRAAKELGVARSTIYRLRKHEFVPDGELIATILTVLCRPRPPSERAFSKMFTIIPTKE